MRRCMVEVLLINCVQRAVQCLGILISSRRMRLATAPTDIISINSVKRCHHLPSLILIDISPRSSTEKAYRLYLWPATEMWPRGGHPQGTR
jgi:hypothetical protein